MASQVASVARNSLYNHPVFQSYYALVVRGRMRPGDSVLIHAGTGGVGQASIAIALHMGCTVFTTVGSKEKREFLKKRFPQLTDRYICNSRDTTFEQQVLIETDGRGVDIVLNSLAEEKLQASVRCLAKDGRFLEIGKYDLSNNSPLGKFATPYCQYLKWALNNLKIVFKVVGVVGRWGDHGLRSGCGKRNRWRSSVVR